MRARVLLLLALLLASCAADSSTPAPDALPYELPPCATLCSDAEGVRCEPDGPDSIACWCGVEVDAPSAAARCAL